MRTLTFVVDKQDLQKHGDFNGLTVGTNGCLHAWFRFSTEWSGRRRLAIFTCNAGEFPALIIGGTCAIPNEVTACKTFDIRVVGMRKGCDDMISTRVSIIQDA